MGQPSVPAPSPTPGRGDQKTLVKQQQHTTLIDSHQFIRFKGTTLVEQDGRFVPLTQDAFAHLFYQHFPYASIQQIREVEHRVRADSPDWTPKAHLIAFGPHVWNTKTLQFDDSLTRADTVYRSDADPRDDTTARPQAHTYMLQLANGDPNLAQDMLQALAPLFMDKKPAGVCWFVGGGANGKSSLINAVYKIIGDHLTSLTVADLEDGRDAPRLNGVLGNICRESSEGRVEDTERYKAIGTHEDFLVHRFHSQDMALIHSNFHTVFNANNIPIFADKTEGARRRTLIIPFPAHFKDDPTFEARTFTPDFLSGLLSLILEAAQQIQDNHYRYDFSEATLGAKADYDAEVNSAEAFLEHLRSHKVKAFTNYNLLRVSYESWCADSGLVPLGVTALRRVMSGQAGATSRLFRNQADGNRPARWYFIDGYQGDSLESPGDAFNLAGLKIPVGDTAPEPEGATEVQQAKLGEEW